MKPVYRCDIGNGRTISALCALLAAVACLSFATPASAGQIVYQRGTDLWTMQDDGTGQELLLTPADTPTFFEPNLSTSPLNVETLDEPSVDEATGTLLFTGYFDANPDDFRTSGLRADGLYKYEGGEVTRLSLDPASFDDVFHFESEPESMGDGRLIFSNTLCETGTISCTVRLETQRLDELPENLGEGETLDRTNWKTKCDDTLYVSAPAPNPVKANEIAYVGCYTYNQGYSYELIVSGPNQGGERIVGTDDYDQRDPAWRADGQKLIAVEEGTNPGIYEYNPAATNDKRRVVAAPQNYVIESPRYTGDGRIIFEGKTDTDGNGYVDASNIYAVPATCNACTFPGNATPLTTDGDSGTPAWTGHDSFAVPGAAAVVDGILRLDARDGEANDIDVAPAPGGRVAARATPGIRLSDARGLEPGEGCTTVSATTVQCSGVESVALGTGDGHDKVDVTASVPVAVDGGVGNDVLTGGRRPDKLNGGIGNDTLDGGFGTAADTLDGGDGVDTLSYRRRTQPVAVRLDGLRNDGADPNLDATSLAAEEGDKDVAIENAVGGTAGDQVIGGAAVNYLVGGNGDDTLDGGLGGDILDGGGDVDTLSYAFRTTPVAVRLDGLRNDGADPSLNGTSLTTEEGDKDLAIENARGGSGNDKLFGSTAANVLSGRDGNDTLDGGLGADTLDGGAHTDTLSYALRTQQVAVRLDGTRNDGADPDGSGTSSSTEEGDRDIAVENATAGSHNDILFGGSAANVLAGGGGADTLDGGLGPDTIDGGAGTDTMSYSTRTTILALRLDGRRNDGADPDNDGTSEAGEEADQDVGIENARGGSGNDRLSAIVANAVVNKLFGGAGDDRLTLREGTGTVDSADCGDGDDRYALDASDTPIACETALP